MNKVPKTAIAEARLGKEQNLQKAEDMLMDHLIRHPQDTDAWLLLARIECNIPLIDAERIRHYAEHILAYDPGNPYALLFISYTDYYMRGSSDETLYSKLLTAKTKSSEMLAMIEVAKAFYWESRNTKNCIAALKKSIQYSPDQRINLCMLGRLYIKKDKDDYMQIIEGAKLIKRGLENVKVIGDETTPYDPTSITDFFAEFFSGIRISIIEYTILKQIITINKTNEIKII